MLQEHELMSQKEKDYIASVFNKGIASQRTEVDYYKILNGEKIDYDFQDTKKEFKFLFGKTYRRSRKHFRPSVNTDSSFLQRKLLLIQLYDILYILKYINVDEETLLQIEKSVVSYLKDNFTYLVKEPKIYEFLTQFFAIASSPIKKETTLLFYQNSSAITKTNLLFKFLDSNVTAIETDVSMLNKDIWSSNSGTLLGFFLLLKDYSKFNQVLKSFLTSNIVEC